MNHLPGCACHGPGTRAGDGYCLHRFKYLDVDGQGNVHHYCPTCAEAWIYGLETWTDAEKDAIRRAAAAYRRERRVR